MPKILSLSSTLVILFSFTTTILAAAPANKSEIDRHALLCFKSGIYFDPLSILESWSNDSLSFCSWKGVTCGTNFPLRVVSLDLTSAQLSGKISGCLADLTSLSLMNLGGNHLSGTILEELAKLPNLHTLNLSGSNLEGNIPDSLGTSNSISYVNLANNTLTGGIPLSLANCSSLSTLVLSRNNLSGQIPATLFDNKYKLTMVDLQTNSFTGVIPHLHKVIALKFLGLEDNFLSGSIPPSLGNVSSLTYIWLGQNKLSGLIPETLGHVTKLLELDLSFNSLSGNVPLSLYNIMSPEYFSVGSNGLVGKIPSHIGHSLPNLQSLIMGSNRMEGLIPASLANMSNLQMLDLSNNSLHGSVPSLGSLANLHQLVLGRNFLEAHDWSFLTSLKNCTQLTKLSMEGNALNGSLPIAVVNLSARLEDLSVGSNQISGSIPVEISNLVSLTSLRMESNFLSGSIPSTIGKLQRLYILNLSKNKLSGQIPTSVGDITQLGKLYLDDNNLSGNIPGSLGRCKELLELNLSTNSLDGSIPVNLFDGPPLSLGVDFSYNKLTGEIPSEVGHLANLALLNVSDNLLSGAIPEALGSCATLLFLRMERNKLQGQIPQSFARLLSIQQINLARNSLSGPVPEFFVDITFLDKLDLSYNNFEGPIPSGGCFLNSSMVVLDGNKMLCAKISMLGLPVCDGTSSTHVPLSTIVIIITLLLAGFLLLYLAVTIWRRTQCVTWCDRILSVLRFVANRKRNKLRLPSASVAPSLTGDMYPRVSYSNLFQATNGFIADNLVGTGRYGCVYKGRMTLNKSVRTVAVKVFDLEQSGSLECFVAECKALSKIRHRNLIGVVTCCSCSDFNRNDFKAILIDFMPYGGLDKWLHPDIHASNPVKILTLVQRLSIASDTATALDYLHNHCRPTTIVHCDLKPSNILLGDDMVAHVGDFGLARILTDPDGDQLVNSKSSLVGTIGYVPPEYGDGAQISPSADVYSFGIVLLEMFTGKAPTHPMFTDGLTLLEYAKMAYPVQLMDIIDPLLLSVEKTRGDIDSYMYPVTRLALACSRKRPADRLSMRDVVAEMSKIRACCAVYK